MNGSLGQEMTVGCSSSYHYVLQSGFWGRYGSTLVPVILMVTRDMGDPDWPRLDWSGNNAPYSIYRAIDCSQIFSGLYDSTGEKYYTDESPPSEDLTCYNILATAPGRSGESISPELNGSIRAPWSRYEPR